VGEGKTFARSGCQLDAEQQEQRNQGEPAQHEVPRPSHTPHLQVKDRKNSITELSELHGVLHPLPDAVCVAAIRGGVCQSYSGDATPHRTVDVPARGIRDPPLCCDEGNRGSKHVQSTPTCEGKAFQLYAARLPACQRGLTIRGYKQVDPDAAQSRRRSIETLAILAAAAVPGLHAEPARAATSPVEEIRAARDLLDSIPGALLLLLPAHGLPASRCKRHDVSH